MPSSSSSVQTRLHHARENDDREQLKRISSRELIVARDRD